MSVYTGVPVFIRATGSCKGHTKLRLPLLSGISIRVSHLQFFWISLLFQAGTSVCHIQEQKKYRSSMFYVGIFQLFFTFVSYNYNLMAKFEIF